ncbi:MAG: CBS domain-containing protein [Planctomycetes bacterium]|nr:CBS domain-containing protein [Planctomycetota bacterium]
MGEQKVNESRESAELRAFVRHVLRDLRALEIMLEQGLIESGITRIGAEQEFFLVDGSWRPTPAAPRILERMKGRNVTPELARFNIEINAPPYELTADCLSQLEGNLVQGAAELREVAREIGAEICMTGILPTLVISDLSMSNMADSPRYRAFDEALKRLRGGAYEFRIKGTDELNLRHDSVMIEACNTSFQVHIQVEPGEFTETYNTAQLVSAPVLAAATNSPILFSQRLWRETRLALFQQSMDTRQASQHQRETSPRVNFGDRWITGGILEILKEDISRFRVLLGMPITENPFEALEAGRPPSLDALRLHNGTVYRWNRPCYGVGGGKPHIRIENRLLPSGPSIIDEVANAAFWLGLMVGMRSFCPDFEERMEFDDAKGNLVLAARHGLAAQFTWIDGMQLPAQELILEHLLPVAEAGLASRGVAENDRRKYLGVIENRVRSGLTGSQWILSSLASMRHRGSRTERLAAVTAGLTARQEKNEPVHTWSLADIDESGGWKRHYQRVEQYMTTDLFTVNQDEAVDLVACLMDWRHIRHVPVEDDAGRLVGLVSHRLVLRLVANGWSRDDGTPKPVKQIMQRDVVSVSPETTTLDAIRLMKERRVSCLPVIKDDHLVGMVTESDLVRIAAPLLEQALSD